MTYAINEVFLSTQGEGPDVGRLAAFVRFSGCNLACSFCDTAHEQHFEMDAGDIERTLREMQRDRDIDKRGKMLVVLTGGEPLLQVDEDLLTLLARKFELAVETNGSHGAFDSADEAHEVAQMLSWFTRRVVVSPKDADLSDPILRVATDLKVLVPSAPDVIEAIPAWLGKLASNRDGVRPGLFLQPITPTGDRHPMQARNLWLEHCGQASKLQRDLDREHGIAARIVPQTHVWMGLR
jgi:organic radical activating enzyme